MVTDNNFVRSGRERIADDNYQTVDDRCMDAFYHWFNVSSGTVIDCCSPNGSGILRWFDANTQAHTCDVLDAFSKDYYCDWNIFNPPYKRGIVDRIILAQIEGLKSGKTRVGCAALLRTGFDHAKTRKNMFENEPTYAGQIKMTFRPIWFEGGDSTPIHNYVWHIWTSENLGISPRVWYW